MLSPLALRHRAFALCRLAVIVLSVAVLVPGCGKSSGGGGILSGSVISGAVGEPGSIAFPAPPGTAPGSVGVTFADAIVEALDADSNVVESATTDANGSYSMRLQPGSYQLRLRVGSLDRFIPLSTPIIVTSDSVDGVDSSSGGNVLDFEVPPVSTTVTGSVSDGSTGVADLSVEFVDSESGTVRYVATTDSSGNFSVSVLPLGGFRVRVSGSGLPSGFATPTPQTLSVTSSGASPSSLSFTLPAATSVSGGVTSTSGLAPALPLGPDGVVVAPLLIEAPLIIQEDAVVIVSEVGFGEVARFAIDGNGNYDLDVRDGSYILEFVGFGDDVVAPAPIRITVKGGEIFLDSQDTPINPGGGDQLGVTAFDVSASLTGTITRGGNGVQTRVVAINPASGGIVAKADTASDGSYVLPLADGSYDITLQGSALPPGVVPPSPVRVAVEVAGDPNNPIKEDQGTADDGVVSFELASASVILTGVVQDDSGNFLKDARVRARKGTKTVGRAVTNSAGAYSLQLPTGTVDISVNPDSIPAGFLTPDPSRVEIAVADGSATVTSSAGSITSLDLVVTARSPNVTGTVTFDFDGNSSISASEVVGCAIVVGVPDSDEVVGVVPSSPADGGYTLTLPDGTYILGVDPQSLPPGAAPPPSQRVSVTSSGVTLADGSSAASVTLDFELVARAATLTGVVQLGGRGVAVGLMLTDLATDKLVSRIGSTPVSGAYRMPMFPGTYELRVDATTLPAGTAVPSPVILSVDSAGVVSTTTATITTLAITLTRNVATLTGEVAVIRQSSTLPVEVVVQALDPQDYSPLAETVSDPDTGVYSLKLAAGSYAIAIAASSLPPGVLPPAAVVVSAAGTTVTGTGVSGNTLDLNLEDTRDAGAEITGNVFESSSGTGLICELRVFDPINGSVNQNFILSVSTDANGDFAFRAPVGTYRLGVVPDSLSPTAVPPTGVNFSVQGTSVVESNTTFVSSSSENAANDGIIKFSIQDGASSGIGVTGTVTDPSSNPIPGVRVIVKDTTTDEVIKEAITNASGDYTAVLPLGSYQIGLDPNSMPFDAIPPAPKALLAANTGSIVVTTNNGVTVVVNGGGTYDFDFQTTAASQSLSGTILDSNGDPARVFVAIIDPSNDSFVTGRFSEVSDGSYVIQLAPGGYEVQLDPLTLPPGNTSTSAVAISVGASSIVESRGTANDGIVDFTLLSASATISGNVVDANGDPVACFAGALDALTNEFVTGIPTQPSTGAYSLTLPPGTYKVGVDPQSLPAGVVPPALTVVDVSSSNQTFNMTLQLASATVSGTVTGASSSQPIPCFLILRDASTDLIVAETPTTPNGAFALSAAPGFYELIVESGSLPPGTITPNAVPVQFTSSGVLESNTVGGSNVANDGIVKFSITEASGGGLATLTGDVTLTIGGNSNPIGAFVFVRNASTGDFIAGGPSAPGNGGAYTLLIPDGTYEVLLDSNTLPPGVVLPDAVLINVNTGSIVQTVGGLPVTSSTLDFALSQASNAISGTVTLSSNGFPCAVRAINDTTNNVVAIVPTNGSGAWSLSLPNGTFRIKVDPNSLPPGVLPPASVTVTTSGGIIVESAGTANDGIIPLVLTSSQATLSGNVEDSSNSRLFAFVVAINAADGEVVAGAPTGPSQNFNLPLFDGTFDIVVDPPSLPLDAVPPVPTRVSVSGTSVTVTSAGSGTVVGSDLVIGVTLQTSAVSVPVTLVDADANPMSGVVRVRDGAGNLLFFKDIPASVSGAPVLLGDGTYSLSVLEASLPPGFDAPSAQSITVTAPTASPSNIAFTATRPTLTGTIIGAASSSTPLIAMDLLNGQGVVLSSGVTLNGSGSDATYSVDLGEGSFTLRFRRASGVAEDEVLLPENVTVNVAGGVIQNPDDDSGTAGVQVDIEVPELEGVVQGTVTFDASPLEGLRIVVRDPVDQSVVNEMPTDSNGDFSLAVPAGFFKLRVDPGSLALVAPTALPTSPYEVQVSSAGDISIVGNGGLCAGGGPGETCTSLDFALTSFDQSTNAQVTGSVTARATPSSTAVAVAGATVLLIDSAGVPAASAVTNVSGDYTLIVTEGIYEVIVDPSSVQASFPTVPEASVSITVVGTNVTESDTTGTGNDLNDGTVNFVFEGASALVQGRLQTSGGTGVGGLLAVTSANQTEVIFETSLITPTDPSGNYFLPMGAGNFKLWVLPSSLPPGFLPPQPTTFSVSGSTVTESNTAGANNIANDGIINPILSSGGATILGQVEDSGSNPVPAFVALLQPASNPSDPPQFVTGAPANPTDGTFEITAPDGSYLLEIDPFSLPPGLQAPPRITLSVSGGVVTFGPLATTTTVGPDTVVVFTVATASDEIRGTVKDSSGNPFPVTIFVRDVTNDAIVNTVFLNPNTGAYSVLLGTGTFDVLIDPGSVPPGFVAPAPVRVTINGSGITETNVTGVDPNGGASNGADDGVVNFVLQTSGANLTGYVRNASGDGVFAGVGLFQANSSGNYTIFVTGAPSDFETGFFSIPVVTGTYQVKLDPGSLPPGVLPPAPVTFSVSGSTLTFPSSATTEDEGGIDRLILTLQGATGGVSGAVTNSAGNGVPVFVVAKDANTNEFVVGAPTNTDGTYSLSLPSGLFRILVDPNSVPQGNVVSAPQEVSVTTSVVSNVNFTVQTAQNTFTGYVLVPGDSIDLSSPSIDCSDLGNEDVTPVSCTVALVIPSQDPNSPPTFLGQTQTSAATGSFSFPLGDGSYQIVVDAGSLPTGVVPPSPVSLVVTGTSISVVGSSDTCSNNSSQLLIFAEQGAGSLTGTVTDPDSNPVGCFVELVNASNGNFVSGTPTDPGTGDFSMSVGSLSYELRVAPDSVPPGLIPPAPVPVTVSGGVVTIGTGSGVSVSGNDVTIQLSSASATVSGTVTDSSGNGVIAFVQAFDSNDNFVGGVGTNGASGAYSIPLAPGIYEIKVDPFSLPPGFSAPAPTTVNLVQANSATANFAVSSTAATITGEVFFINGSAEEVGVPAFVEVVDAASGAFIAGANANPDGNGDFVYSVGVGSGSFRVRVAPDSLPPGVVSPGPVGFTVTVNSSNGSVTIQENAHGSDNDLTNGVIDFELETAGATLNGQLVTDDGQGGNVGVVGFVFVETTDGSGTRVAEAGTNGSGSFSMSFADGNYVLFVDPQSLPPGLVAPSPKNMTVVGSSITIAGAAVSGTYTIDLATAGAILTGNVVESDATPVVGAFVVALDPATDAFIAGSSTDSNGDYSVPLGDGTYLIVIDPNTIPAGAIAPPPEQISVSGSTISQDGSPISAIDFVVGAADASISVEVVDNSGAAIFCEVQVVDAQGQFPVASAFYQGTPVVLGLSQGNYFVAVPSFSLPPGVVSPTPVSLTVNGDGSTVDGAGASGDGFIRFTLTAAAATLSGSVTFNSAGVAGATVVAVDPDNDQDVASSLTAGDGSYSLDLPSGEYLIEVAEGIPAGAVDPAPFLVFVDSAGTISPSSTIDFTLQPVEGIVSGTLTLNGVGHAGFVVAFTPNLSGGFDQVTDADADSSGSYTLNVGDGDFVFVVGIDEDDLRSPDDVLIPPLPTTLTVTGTGTPQNFSQDFALFTVGGSGAPVSQLLLGSVTAGGAAFDARVQVLHDGNPMALAQTNPSGPGYRIALLADTQRVFTVGLSPESLPSGFAPPTPVEITVDDTAITGTGVVPNGSDFQLDFAIGVSGAALNGAISDASGNPLAGVEVSAINLSSGQGGASAFSDSAGDYTLILPVGSFEVELVGLDSSTVRPLPAEVEVTDEGSGNFGITVDGSDTNLLDFDLESAVTRLSGQLTLDGAPVAGEIIAFASGIEVTFVNVSPSGSYTLPLAVGDFTVIPILDNPGVAVMSPSPATINSTDTGTIVDIAQNFAFTSASPSGAGLVSGQVQSDGSGYETSFLVFDLAGNLLTLIDTDQLGNFSIALADGTYLFVLEDTPQGYTGPTSLIVEVTANGINGPGFDNGMVVLPLNTVGNMVSGTVTDSSGSPVADIYLVFDSFSMPSTGAYAVTDSSGDYQVLLADGNYDLEVHPLGFPSTLVLPPAQQLSVASAPVTVDLQLATRAGLASGTVSMNGSGTEGDILAFDLSGNLITETSSLADGTYTLGLPLGDFVLFAGLDLPQQELITPDPQGVTIDQDTSLTGIDFDFLSVGSATSVTLTGSLLVNGTAVAGEVLLEKSSQGEFLPFALVETSDVGEPIFSIALTAGDYRLTVLFAGTSKAVGSLQPSLFTVTATEIQVDGSPLPNNDLQIIVEGQPQPAAALSGELLTTTGPLVGATVVLAQQGGASTTTVTNAEGEFSFATLTEGRYDLTIDASTLSGNAALPRQQLIWVDSAGVHPSRVNLYCADSVGDLSGTVTVDSVGAAASVTIYDMGLHAIGVIATDVSGAYSVPMAAGTYSVVANLSSPAGNEIPPISSPVAHSGATTHDIAFVTSGISQSLSGALTDGGISTSLPLLILSGDPPAVMSRVFPDLSGTYLTNLPEGVHTVMLDPNATDGGVVASAGVVVTVDSLGIAGTDDDGIAIANNTLNLDPASSSDSGQVRAALSDLFEAIFDGDVTALGNLLDDTAVIGGKNKTALLADWPNEDWWGAPGYQFDRLQGVLTPVSADEFTCAIVRGREVEQDDVTGFHSERNWAPGFGERPDWILTVVRASSGAPWLVAGNGLSFEAAEVEHGMMSMLIASVSTNFEWVEFLVDESEELLSGVTVSGTGVTNGTLTEEVFLDSSEWRAEVDSQESGPAPFDATLGSIADGELYTFTANLTAGGTEVVALTHNAPSGSLFPTALLNFDSSVGTVRFSWNEISAQMLRPVATIGVEVIQLGDPNDLTIDERDDLPLGTQTTLFEASNFSDGETYRFEVYYVDTGGAVQAYGMEVLWPPSAP